MRQEAWLVLAALVCVRAAQGQTPAGLNPVPPSVPAVKSSPILEFRTENPGENPGPSAEQLVTFDSLRADLKDVNGRWQLWADGVLLKDFGNHEVEGRQALRLIRELRLTHRGTLGKPRPVVEYWFADRGASQGLASDLRVYPIDPQALRVERLQNQWCLCDSHRALLTFGSDAGAAHQALDVVRDRAFTGI